MHTYKHTNEFFLLDIISFAVCIFYIIKYSPKTWFLVAAIKHFGYIQFFIIYKSVEMNVPGYDSSYLSMIISIS